MLLDALKERILILDGAMGTMLQQYSLEESDFKAGAFSACAKELKGNNECLNITHPEILQEIHSRYIEAGADIISTNTFSANRISQSEYDCAEFAPMMALEGARIARRAADMADRKVWVAGDIGPTGKSLSLASDISDPAFRPYSFDDMADAYREQVAALVEGGADLLLIETCFDALNVKACLYAISQLGVKLPVMVSVSVGDRSGRTLTGQTLEAFYRSVEHAGLLSFGLNCSLGATELEPMVADICSFAECRVSCHPNAGLPDEMGRYNDSPEHMAQAVLRMAQAGHLNIAGGCCGTTPEHIRHIAEALKGVKPRDIPPQSAVLTVSGLEAVSIDSKKNNFTNIGERTNVAGSRKFAKLIAAKEYDTALQIAAGQIENGASVIDINMDDAMLDSKHEMMTFLRHISNDPAVARAAIMIDSSNWDTVVEGLKNAQGKCIVNSISLKEGEEAMLAKASFIKVMGGAMVIMAFDEEGQATTYERKIEICGRAYRLLTEKAGVRPQDIIFDVNVLSVGTGIAEHRRYGVDFIEAVRWIKTNLPGALTSGGISNLSFAFRGNNPVREAMHSAFLYHATAAGLDMGIVNPGMLQIYDEIEPDMLKKVEDVILDRSDEATEILISKAQEALTAAKGESTAAAATVSIASTAEERIVNALVKGSSATLHDDIMEVLGKLGKPVDVIEGPLMDGMKKVGEYFGEGKMFLPQVVKSAKTMRDAVDVLKPFMEEDGKEGSAQKPKVVIATVKGDVHDIGKNITAIVLNCNGFEVTDLGVMVAKETILDTAQEIGVDMIAVSGLITPSLFQMEEICREMTARGMSTPLFIGGATTSAVHTAVKLAPLYDHVFYGADASASAVLCKSYMMDEVSFEREEHAKQAELRALYESAPSAHAAAGRTAASGKGFPKDSYLEGVPFKDIEACEIPVSEVLPHFDWRMFYAVWGVKEDLNLRADAEKMIEHLISRESIHIRLALHFEEAFATEDDSIVLNSGRSLPMMRQSGNGDRSLADFVPAEQYGTRGPVGFFATSVHVDRHHDCDCPECNTDYEPMLLRSIRVTLAEAASSWVDAKLESELPEGSEAHIVKPAAGYYSCPDHTMKRDIMEIIPDSDSLGIEFTETYAMIPDASICAFVFAHPQACYPDIRRASDEAISRYASKRGFSDMEARTFLDHLKD